jgi:Na+/melibiose symporter-like transporter
VNWRVLRHLLIVLGALFLALQVQPLLQAVHMMAGIGIGYTDAVFSEATAALVGEFPRAITGALAMVLIWYALGPALAQRWMWVLAGLATMSALLSLILAHRSGPLDYTWVVVSALLPAIGCLLAGNILQRAVPAGPGEDAIPDEVTPPKGRTVALVVGWCAVALAVGGLVAGLTALSVLSARCR